MKILYKKILDLELWHDYYLGQPEPPELPQTGYDTSSLLMLVPTPECLHLLQNLRWVFRLQPHGGNLFAQVDETETEDFQPFIPVGQPLRLTFSLVVRDRYFANFTNLPLTTASNKIYYFSNLSENQGHDLFLTKALPTYDADTKYNLGDLVVHEGNILEALRYQNTASSPSQESDWETLPGSQYASVLDQLPLQGLSRTQTITGANPGDIFRFALVDVNQQEAFAFEFTVPDNHPLGEEIAISLNFSGLAPGRYQLDLNSTQIDEFVLLDPMANSNAFALVEIVLNQSLVPAEFSLLEASLGETLIRPKTYVIRFKNRATRWRYKYEPQHPHSFCLEGESPEEDGCVLIDPRFVVLDTLSYATKRPVGLRQQPGQLLNDGNKDLPVPRVVLIKPETNDDQQVSNIFSDVHI